MLIKLDKLLRAFEDFILVYFSLSAAIVLFVNVVMRYVFKNGFTWAEEYAKYAILWITFAGCGAAARNGAHMRVTALLDFSKNDTFVYCINLIVNVVAIAFSVFLMIAGFRMAMATKAFGQVTTAMGLPMWIIEISVPIGGFLMALRFFQQLLKMIKGNLEGGAPE